MEKALTTTQAHTAMIPVEQIERMAHAFAKSGLFGIKTVEQGVALMLIAQAEGLHPAVAARDYNIIQGRPALKADAMLARFHAAGGKVVWNVYTDNAVSATFSHLQGGTATVEWTLAQAKAAGLTGKDVWKQYPRAMLRSRVISEGIRTVYPGVSVGVYTPEELTDMDGKPASKEVEALSVQDTGLTPAQTIQPKADEKTELFAKLKTSTWTKEQLAQYSEAFYGHGTSSKLSTEQLSKLVAVCTTQTFDHAMNTDAEWEQL